MNTSELLTNVGMLVAAFVAGFVAYFKTKPPSPPSSSSADTIVAGVGLELGNRLQVDQVIAELKRIADCLSILADRRQATTEAKLDRILRELEEAEEHEAQRVRRAARPRRVPRARKTD